MRTYFDCGLIDVGVIVTRAEELNDIFKDAGIMAKYGASTTWMGKLLYRLDSRRNGGCPILAVGIKRGALKGMNNLEHTAKDLIAFTNGKNITPFMPIHRGNFRIVPVR